MKKNYWNLKHFTSLNFFRKQRKKKNEKITLNIKRIRKGSYFKSSKKFMEIAPELK